MHTEGVTMAKPKRRKPEPFIDWNNTYRADQLNWIDDGKSWAVIAVREKGGDGSNPVAWNPKSGGY